MCLILFAYDCHPQYRLVVASNRDEFYNRPSLPAAFWPDKPDILAGKDIQQGGTWMGITSTGRFAALTNYRDPSNFNPKSPSRGDLVQNYLNSIVNPESYLEKLIDDGEKYNGFNLLAGTYKSLFYYSNKEKLVRKVEKGIHGLSNSLLDVPWPKVTKGIKSLADCLQDWDINAENLFALMEDTEVPDDQELPQTGLSLEKERMVAPAYVVSQDYGTKSTTIILVDRNNNVRYWERSLLTVQSGKTNEVYYEFMLNE